MKMGSKSVVSKKEEISDSLILRRKPGEGFVLLRDGDPVATIRVCARKGNNIKVSIKADPEIDVLREELLY